jgi:sulfatase maturation enzyme AslB (radical SAM superfamily)
MDGIIISFIGGEPLLEIKLINEIWEYFIEQLIKLNHPWKKHFRGCICSNGIPYFNTDVQEFLQKYSDLISFTISLDGNKELHDSCRVDFNGLGSYDKAISAIHHYREHYGDYLGTKMTLSPYNITHLYDAVINLIDEKYTDIHLNCVYEEGWTIEHAKIMYQELIKLADYIIDNNLNE